MLLEGKDINIDINKGQKLMNSPAKKGKLFAVKTLCESYKNGQYGYVIDREKADYWCQLYEKLK